MVQALARRSPKWIALAAAAGALALGGSARAADLAGAKAASAAEDAMLKGVVHEHREQVLACFNVARLASPGLQGKLVYGWSITPKGTFGDGCVTSSEFNSDFGTKLAPGTEDELGHCIGAAVREWRFPAPRSGQKTEVSFSFVLQVADSPAAAAAEAL